jgi:hypothetical protein
MSQRYLFFLMFQSYHLYLWNQKYRVYHLYLLFLQFLCAKERGYHLLTPPVDLYLLLL